MASLNSPELSESEEMYLVTAVTLAESGVAEPIPLSHIAQALSIQPVSVNQMVRKLADSGYVNYLPYKGIELKPVGRQLAYRILRRRRLWEFFLVRHLEMAPSAADALACRLEHITPPEVVERLDRFLERPSVSPQGLPIPDDGTEEIMTPAISLSELAVGMNAEVARLDVDTAVAAFLQAEGLKPGIIVQVEAVSGQGALLLRAGDQQLTISDEIAEKVFVF